MKKLFKIIGIVFIFIFFSSFALNVVYSATKDDVVIINSEGSEEESGGWVYDNSTNGERSSAFVTKSKCENYRKDNNIKSTTTECYSVYKLLAPIGDLKEAPNNMGDYFNIIFKIAIGLCGALAVVMIVIGGVQYMGDESIFGKTEAKSKIISAILGLLVALGSWALLNTVNPDLLGSKGVTIKSVSANIDQEFAPWSTYEEGDNLEACPSGFTNILLSTATPDKINVCRTIANDLANLINAAKKRGITLSGYGARSKAKQIEFRKQNCGGSANIYKEDAVCNPKTAIPGTSNHEKGIAIDFNCNGQTMEEAGGINSVCYKWLKENASTYGFKNNYDLLKESWHWSTTGT